MTTPTIPGPVSGPSPYSAPTPTYDPYAGQYAGQYAGYGTTPPAPPAPPVAPRRGPSAGLIVGLGAGALAIAMVSGVIGGSVGYLVARQTLPVAATTTGAIAGAPSAIPGSIADIAARVQPAVVQLNVSGAGGEGTGSGFIVSEDGYLITNHHVVGGAAGGGTITVAFSDGTVRDGRLVGSSPGYDLAVVKVDGPGLVTVPLGSSGALNVGDSVIAVGSPLGLSGTVTSGIVSALDRPVTAGGSSSGETAFINAIQTDAAINPGNSGGPLLNGNGEVVGVNSAIATLGGGGQSGSIGLGFSIPIDTAKRIADEIIATGSSTTPVIGVSLDMAFSDGGARIESITAGSGAELAGVQVGDIVTAVDGTPVSDGTELIVRIRSSAPGDSVTLTVLRGGQELQIPVTLGSSQS